MADETKQLFHGVIPALITPFTAAGEVDTAAVPAIVDHLIAKGCSGFYLCGSTGEGMHMSVAERKTMQAAAIAACKGRVPCMVMVGACPIADAVDLARHAEKAGAAAISTIAPGVYAQLKLKDSDEPLPEFDATIAYFSEVAKATALPFYAYWLGDVSGLEPRKFFAAMAHLPNFAGMKYTPRDLYLFERLINLAEPCLGRRLNMLSGADECHFPSLALGSDGAIGSCYNFMPAIYVKLRAAFHAGDLGTARAQQTKANAAIDILLEYAVKGKKLSAIAALKALMREQGLPAGDVKPASRGESWTDAMGAEAVAQWMGLGYPVE